MLKMPKGDMEKNIIKFYLSCCGFFSSSDLTWPMRAKDDRSLADNIFGIALIGLGKLACGKCWRWRWKGGWYGG